MDREHTILFPAFLILFASFLAYNIDDLSVPYVGSVDVDGVRGFISGGNGAGNALTGFVVYDAGSNECDNQTNSTVFLMSSISNAHAAELGGSSSYGACAQVSVNLTAGTPSRTCVGYINETDNTMVYLSGDDNAHAYAPETNVSDLPSGFVKVCYDNLIAQTIDVSNPSTPDCASLGSLGGEWECLVGLSGRENAHVEQCKENGGNYDFEICVKPEGIPAPCPDGTTMCSDGFCRVNCGGSGGITCNNNGVCDPGEGCDCSPDCDYKQDSCANGSICEGGLCETPGSGNDDDNDGVLDPVDNCGKPQMAYPNGLLVPNGPQRGACVNATTHAIDSDDPVNNFRQCFSENGCGANENCSMNQEDFDSDGFGDACDFFPGDSCSALALDDICATPGACENAIAGGSFSWSATSANEGDSLTLTLTLADNSCDGIAFSVAVYDASNVNVFSTTTPLPINVSGNNGVTTWLAEHNVPDVSVAQNWLGRAQLGGSTTAIITTPNSVAVSANCISGVCSYCGDGVQDAGEQCDDGNNVNFDGCSAVCTNEGPAGGGPNCETYCVPLSCVCAGDTSYTCCGDFDGDGCYENSNVFACTGSNVCSNEFGHCVDPSCVVNNQPTPTPSCSGGVTGWACGTWGPDPSDSDYKVRQCMSCGGNCQSTPIQRVYTPIEPATKAPVFTFVNMLWVCLLLAVFYFFRKGDIIIDRDKS